MNMIDRLAALVIAVHHYAVAVGGKAALLGQPCRDIGQAADQRLIALLDVVERGDV